MSRAMRACESICTTAMSSAFIGGDGTIPALGHLLRVGAALQQQRHEGHVSHTRGIHERREGVSVLARVDLRAAVEEEARHLEIAAWHA